MVWLFLVLFAGQFESTFHAGLTALNNNNLALAESRLEAASQLEPRNARVWLALAQTYWKLRKAAARTGGGRKGGGLGPPTPPILARRWRDLLAETGE